MKAYYFFLFIVGLFLGFYFRGLIDSSIVVGVYNVENIELIESVDGPRESTKNIKRNVDFIARKDKVLKTEGNLFYSELIDSDEGVDNLISSLSKLEGDDYNLYMELEFLIVNLLNEDDEALYEIQSLYSDSHRDSDFQGELKEVILKLDKKRIDYISNNLIDSHIEENQILGLDLMSDYKNPSVDDFNVVHRILTEHQVAREVLLASFRSIPAISTTIKKKRDMFDVLEEYTFSGDSEVRFESILAIGKLANNIDQIKPILRLPQTEENKTMTVLAMRDNNIVDSELKDLLIKYAFNENNSNMIREEAINALARFDLSFEEKNQLKEIIEIRDNFQ
jgi:hypothetical protein